MIPSVFRTNLRYRLLLIVLPVCFVVVFCVLLLFHYMERNIVRDLSEQLAVEKVKFDRIFTSYPIINEISKAKIMATSPILRDWAKNENDPVLKKQALSELENFRRSFQDEFFFMIIDKSLNYYSDDGKAKNDNNILKYTLEIGNPEDAWYFETKKLSNICHLNVSRDRVLDVKNVWINCIVRDPQGNEVLGVFGTGINLSNLIRSLVKSHQFGVEMLALDESGAIQINEDERKIDYQSISKEIFERNTIFNFIENEEESKNIKIVMNELKNNPESERTLLVTIDDQKYLLGFTYSPELRWFIVSQVNMRRTIFADYFTPLVGVLILSLIIVVAILLMTLNRFVLRRVARLDAAVTQFTDGKYANWNVRLDHSVDEIGRLNQNFYEMASTVIAYTKNLESLVYERTKELEELASRDPLTGVYNRRFFFSLLEKEIDKCIRYRLNLSLIIFDIDNFKRINDNYGHDVGDVALSELAAYVGVILRRVDVFARYGGEEFIIFMPETNELMANNLAERLRIGISSLSIRISSNTSLTLTASFGVSSLKLNEMDNAGELIKKADLALYQAKNFGRNCVVVSE